MKLLHQFRTHDGGSIQSENFLTHGNSAASFVKPHDAEGYPHNKIFIRHPKARKNSFIHMLRSVNNFVSFLLHDTTTTVIIATTT